MNNSFAESGENIAITSDCGCVFTSVKLVKQHRQCCLRVVCIHLKLGAGDCVFINYYLLGCKSIVITAGVGVCVYSLINLSFVGRG